MDSRKITCMAAATFVGTLLIISATSPVHSQPAGAIEGRQYFDPKIQGLIPYGDLDLANPQGQGPQFAAAFERAKSGTNIAATALIISAGH